MRRDALLGALLLVSTAGGTARAQEGEAELPPDAPAVEVNGEPLAAEDGLVVVVDADDDDENGVVDARQGEDIPASDLREVTLLGRRPLTVRVEGPLRLVKAGTAVDGELTVRPRGGRATVYVQGTGATRAARAATLVVESQEGRRRIPVTVIGLALLDAGNEPVDATRDAVGVSQEITNDASLLRGPAYDAPSPGRRNIRLEVFDPRVEDHAIQATLESIDDAGGVRAARTLRLQRPREGMPFRSPWVRLVGDVMDEEAPGVGERVLRVALRDEVRIRYGSGDALTQGLRVGRPGDEDGLDAARRGQLRVRVLRVAPGGMPVVGSDDAGALAAGRRQVEIANEIWLQCFVGFGDPAEGDVVVVDPPVRSLVAVADEDGLPARGGGTIRFRAGGRSIGPVETVAGAPPVQTALSIARAVRAAGFDARVTENPPTEFGAGRSADVMVLDRAGDPVKVEPEGDAPLTTDARQGVTFGEVDLSDGIGEFDNMTAAAGTIEERALIQALGDDDPTTVDIFVINRFTSGTRQGEAFIEADGGAIVNTLILDRNGIRQEREAWTQSHELGHVLLNQPYHPDNVGPDRPWLLMDSDSSLGLVTGPKRISQEECIRARAMSGHAALPSLLTPMDARPETPRVTGERFDRGYPRP